MKPAPWFFPPHEHSQLGPCAPMHLALQACGLLVGVKAILRATWWRRLQAGHMPAISSTVKPLHSPKYLMVLVFTFPLSRVHGLCPLADAR
jgi:hypothetical protein